MVAPAFILTSGVAYAQTMTTGDVTGTVTDPTGAVVPSATITLKELQTGDTRTVQSNSTGIYRFTYVKPGTYQISASSAGLKSDRMSNLVVAVGQVQTLNLVLKPLEAKEIVMVTDAAPLLQVDNANLASSFSSKQVDLLPAPGGDITTVAFTVPGVVVSTGAGYGNFSSHGLPGISNLFTINGVDNMDPYLNLNNSGASNLTLGANEVQEATVVQNAYSVQYGRQAGAQVNFITKSGTNALHADLLYNYNGSTMNANDFFNNASGTPRGRALSNQYAASIGGPIKKDKLFFYVDTESLRYTLPTSGVVSIPSPAVESYILKNVSATQRPFYQKTFDLFNGAPGANRAVPVTNGDGLLQDSNGALGCGGLDGTPTGAGGTFGRDTGCALAFGTNVSNQNTEWLLTARGDYNISDKQKMFVRYKTDHGLQPTETSAINPLFNAVSNQPDYEGAITHTFIISPRMVNNFLGAATYYSAIFSPADLKASLGLYPMQLTIADGGANGTGGFSQVGVSNNLFPQGRRVGQILISDDLSYIAGRHAIKLGVNFRRNRIADTGNQRLAYGGQYTLFGLDEFASGAIDPATGSSYLQKYTPYPVVHLLLYNLGFYGQDEWALKPNLKVTFGLRLDRTANPECTDNCFARFTSPFSNLSKGATLAYNQSIQTGLSEAFYSIEPVVAAPCLGISYNPSWSKGTVLRGGVGLFSDVAPGFAASSVFGNAPNVFTPNVRTGTIDFGGAGSAPAISQATGKAFQSGFANGATLAQLKAALAPVTFTPPAYFDIPSELRSPKYIEWSFEVQQQMGPKNVVTVSYVGNHGYDVFVRNAKVNANYSASAYPNGFGGLPAAAPDSRFNIITSLTNDGWSNYDGLSVQYRRALGFGFQRQFGYTWSHALDTVSNNGLTLFFSGDSLTNQINPFSLRSLNYSNADYDIRHNFTADFVWEIPARFQHRALSTVLGGWSVASKVYARTGTPFSVINSRIPGRLSPSTGTTILAALLNPAISSSCGASAVDTACFTTSQFATLASQTSFGNLPRNGFRGPGYFDWDSSIYKTIRLAEHARFTVGASAYNTFNHPNFGSPGQNVAVPGLGLITSTVSSPTSPYGSFQGSAVSGRVLVVTGKFHF